VKKTKKPSTVIVEGQHLDSPWVPSHEQIAVEAEVLWRQRGCPEGSDHEIWLEAERLLHHVAKVARDEGQEKEQSDTLSRLDLNSDDVMGELGELFPGPSGPEATSL
jgi:hypothetical protein